VGFGREIALLRDPDDPTASSAPVTWAADRLRSALEDRGVPVRSLDAPPHESAIRIVVAGADHPPARLALGVAGVEIPRLPESFGLVPADEGELLVTGADVRGLVYAVLELADRVELATDPLEAIELQAPTVERPANLVRSVARLFTSEVHDKPWFHDEDFWRRYLSMAVAQRFNRVNLMVGLGYNFPWRIRDPYLYFAYPFLVDVRGSGVRVPQLSDEERDRNLAMLRFISEEADARGLEFRFGMWTHAFRWFESEDAPYTIEGLDDDRHAEYCAEAVRLLLEACPSIGGLTLRTHGESGIPERSWQFWKVVFDGIVRAGRPIELDLHAKGLDPETLDLAVATGLPLTVSPKFSAEHMGLPYHQAAMREQDRLPTEHDRETEGKASFMNVCEGTRPFTRYSYGDFLREDRPYDVVFRIWPGTQRVLLWGDPAMAAGFGRNASIAGTEGLEWCEPLSLEGREGTGHPGARRDGSADPTPATADDWERHAYSFRLMGRLLYDPDASPDGWRRWLRASHGPAAEPAEAALASASRVMPLVTSAHHPSASNNYYWPEVYTDIGIVADEDSVETHYYDTPEPKRFGTVTPLDPEIFLTVEESARELETGVEDGRISALEVASWLERLAADATAELTRIEQVSPDPPVETRRLAVDVAIQAALGLFFAGKLRAGVGYERFRLSGEPAVLAAALGSHRSARDAWADAVAAADGVYATDLTYGTQAWLRGTWADRLPAIDDDLAAMEALAASAGADQALPPLDDRPPPAARISHDPPSTFTPGEDLRIVLATSDPVIVGATLRYRPVNQAEAYREVEMAAVEGGFSAAIPAADLDADRAVQYHLFVRGEGGRAWLHPDLGPELSGRPYHVVRPGLRSRT
jgi:hypothetical protein